MDAILLMKIDGIGRMSTGIHIAREGMKTVYGIVDFALNIVDFHNNVSHKLTKLWVKCNLVHQLNDFFE